MKCAHFTCHACPDQPHESPGRTEYAVGLEREVERLRAALTAIVDAYPYLNCVCGRNKPRMSGETRNAALVALGREPWAE